MLPIAIPYYIIHKARIIRKIIRRQLNGKITSTSIISQLSTKERHYILFLLWNVRSPIASTATGVYKKSPGCFGSKHKCKNKHMLKLLDNQNSLGENGNMTDVYPCGYMMCIQLKWKDTNNLCRFSSRKMEWDLKR